MIFDLIVPIEMTIVPINKNYATFEMIPRSTQVSDCGKYMIVSIVKACRDNLLYFADLEKNGEIIGKIPLTPIVTEFEADYDVSANCNQSHTHLFLAWNNRN